MARTLLTREYLHLIGIQVGSIAQLQQSLPAGEAQVSDVPVGSDILEPTLATQVENKALASNVATSNLAPSKSAARKIEARQLVARQLAAKQPAASGVEKLKIVALHGHAQSGSRFKGKIAAVAKDAKSLAEFEFLDGPFPVPHCEHSLENELGAAFTWIDVSQLGEGRKGVWTKYAGAEKSFEMIRSLDCDGIIAFSLGAAVFAACLCHPDIGPELRSRLKFVGLFSGFVPEDPDLKAWIEAAAPLTGLPSFHCMGRVDEEIAVERSEALAKHFDGAVLHHHDGGHVVPAAVRKDFKSFLAGLSR